MTKESHDDAVESSSRRAVPLMECIGCQGAEIVSVCFCANVQPLHEMNLVRLSDHRANAADVDEYKRGGVLIVENVRRLEVRVLLLAIPLMKDPQFLPEQVHGGSDGVDPTTRPIQSEPIGEPLSGRLWHDDQVLRGFAPVLRDAIQKFHRKGKC